MAYAALVSLQQTTDLILHHHTYSIPVNDRENITSIREYVIFLISFLENSSEKANRLEGKIRDLANEAEDLIEYFMWNQRQMQCYIGSSRVEFEQQLKIVRAEIGSITGDVIDDRLCHLPAPISSSASSKNDVVVGLDEDLIAVKGRLCGESSKLKVIPIVGMGGIGKTTLARHAFDDQLIIEHFDIHGWVTVSQDYSVDEILSRLLVSMRTSGDMKESEVAEKVYKSLKGRRYLIVMDDIWSTNAWDDVRNIFPDDNNGSRIMLTTRLSDVAAYASSGSPLHEMKFMDGNQSWDLLMQKAFTSSQDCPPELEDIGKAIARGCRGLPLVVVLLAGILSTNVKTQALWEKISKNVNSVVDGQLDRILSLSYKFLPHHLRPCFLFMAAFSEDYNIRVSRLIKLWVAEGFLKHQDGCKTLEEEAEEYLEDLVKRNLVLVSSRKSNGKIKRCSLHDLVRDLCVRKAEEEKFVITSRYALPNGRKDERRISIHHSCFNEIRSPTIHTILCFARITHGSSLASLEKFRLLRVLDVIYYNYSILLLPPQVFELIHLRYLSLGFPTNIPAAISNLQTLIIHPRGKLRTEASLALHLPVEIWRMPQLRHLLFGELYILPDPMYPLPLENLQTLSGISSDACRESILKMIPNLKKLGVVISEHHNLENLVHLHRLEKLKITAPRTFSWQGGYPVFPRTVKKLTLDGGQLCWFIA